MGRLFSESPVRTVSSKESQLLTYSLADERNFQVTIRAYKPPFVRCQDTVPASRPSSKACATILDTMNASARQTTFGARGVADVDEYLPQLLTDRKIHFPKRSVSAWVTERNL